MNIKLLLAAVLLTTGLATQAQTLFTYGKYTATVPEFLKAFEKNNAVTGNKANAKKEYLDLYINSRLKIRQAYDRGYDTTPALLTEISNLRSQVIDNYLTDQNVIDKLSSEAFVRSQKDIHATHIFIAFSNTNGTLDTTQAYKKLQEVLTQLKTQDFGTVAAKYSDDPTAKTNKGDLGFVTVFTLPYSLENLLYNTATGKYSPVYTSAAGYHIVKNVAERKALGVVKAQQILLAFPPDATTADKNAIAKTADSLYNAIRKGSDFLSLLQTFSNDYVSASAGGTMPDIGVGRYHPIFEDVLFSLKKDNDVSKPFLTEHGWHIVKRVGAKPIITSADNKENADALRQKVLYDDRWKTSRNHIYTAVEKSGKYKKNNYNTTALWNYSDSALYLKPAGVSNWDVNTNTVLFSIDNNNFTADDWINYAQAYRSLASQGATAYSNILQEYTKQSMYNYYRDHLEDFNPEFKAQMDEFTEGNMFFEIMQQEVWNKSQNDTAQLLALYNSNPAKYNWNKSADAVVFFCNDAATAKTLHAQIKSNPAKWKTYVSAVNEKVVADSARYELDQIPGFKNTATAKTLSPLNTNSQDNATTFSYVFKVYNTPTPRTYNEAKGLVISDYQTQLEAAWLKDLKQNYPVTLNEAEWNKIK